MMSRPLGLGALLRGGEATDGMSLPAALNAIRRGELQAPPDDDLAGLMPPAQLPPRPPPAPKRLPEQDILDEARARHQADIAEMRVVIEQKRAQLAASAIASRDPC